MSKVQCCTEHAVLNDRCICTAGDAQGFTDTYLEGLALQCQSQRTVGKDTIEIFEQVLPYELFMKIFGYLSVKELCTAAVVCKVTGLILTCFYMLNVCILL